MAVELLLSNLNPNQGKFAVQNVIMQKYHE